ncbi:MAG TPA: DNRLRE domain-containing protein [Candidatus Limnocylindria bacterium]|nr:DNRLRE domain-containing protein [Candidatus Limnocylindria bacterium]
MTAFAPLIRSAVLAGAMIAGLVSVYADTISLQPAADTTLIEIAPGNNMGGAIHFNAGTTGNGNRNRALMFFDLSSAIPAGATITGAELSLDIVRQPEGTHPNSIFSLRRVLQSWNEGLRVPDESSPGQGSLAIAGEATWNDRFAAGTAWSVPGGLADTDFSSTLSSSAFVGGVGEQVLFSSSDTLIADIQFWLDHSEANFGWMFKTESESVGKTARSFASRESGFGPTLTITFTAVPEPSAISLATLCLICAALVARRRS